MTLLTEKQVLSKEIHRNTPHIRKSKNHKKTSSGWKRF